MAIRARPCKPRAWRGASPQAWFRSSEPPAAWHRKNRDEPSQPRLV